MFSKQGELLLYLGKPFSGERIDLLPGIDILVEQEFQDGYLHGKEIEKDFQGNILASREYRYGIRDGRHVGYFPTGQKKFEYTYKDNLMEGEAWEYYQNGSVYTFLIYEKGSEKLIKRWREDGQIYLNLVVKNGIAYGLAGGKLCNQVRADSSGKTKSF